MLVHCRKRQEDFDHRKCWNCRVRELRSTIECRLKYMKEYRLYCLYRGKDFDVNCGYYSRKLRAVRKLQEEGNENSSSIIRRDGFCDRSS